LEEEMFLAKNNIIVKLDREIPVEYAILNPVAGNFDLMTEAEYSKYREIESGESKSSETAPGLTDYLLNRGYAFETKDAYEASRKAAYDEFKNEVKDAQVQLMLIPTYACNLACTYCFQHGIDGRPQMISKETVDSFFDYARVEFADAKVKPFITLFGGEPLINSKAQREIIEHIVEHCVAEGYEIAAVTNGYDFAEYVDLLSKAKIKEIQFTLDGGETVHDKRRMTANKKGTFDRVIKGMDKAVSLGVPINLRSVIDKENVDDLVVLAQLMDERGWLDLPPQLFKTQIGRNYELFECYEKPQHLFTQVELWAYVAKLAEAHPVLKKFHRPDFMGIRYLVETGEMYLPSFDTCPAAKTEWVFDLYGDIYGCTASCGREEFKLGTYWPEVTKNEEAIQTWKNRDITNIEKCKDCTYDIVCGGGCGVVAANRHDGEILAPDCRPIQELYDIGLNFYNKEIHDMMKEEEEPSASADTKNILTPDFPQNDKYIRSGCMICGEPLVYTGEATTKSCDICGEIFQSKVSCVNGHYVCDNCHRGDALDHMEALLIKSTETNPILLADLVFHLPTMKMHGPEHHSMVPAVLETAHQNLLGIRDKGKIRETISRGKDIKGGSCGFHGTCGACVGTGIAESVFLGAKPSSKEERGSAMRATGNALLAISKFGGPLCCKRDSIASIENYMTNSDRFAEVEPAAYICSFSKYNKGCLTKDCPYFPKVAGKTRTK
jgi:uncharacterized protein